MTTRETEPAVATLVAIVVAARRAGDREQGRQARRELQERHGVKLVFAGGGFVCLPTAPCPAPLRGLRTSAKREVLSRIIRLTCIAGTTGRPQLSLPLGEVNGFPVGISIMGDHGSDEKLIGFARRVEAALIA